jgi:hypothetical protein
MPTSFPRTPRHATRRDAPDREARRASDLLAVKIEVHRSAILGHLTSAGIMGGEKNPVSHLASFMSDHRHLYVSDGKGNFRLRSETAATNEVVSE